MTTFDRSGDNGQETGEVFVVPNFRRRCGGIIARRCSKSKGTKRYSLTLFGSLEFGGDSDFVSSKDSSQFDIFDEIGTGLNLQFGYDFGLFRSKIDIGQSRTNIDTISLFDGSTGAMTRLSNVDGYTQNSRFMLNMLYDYELTKSWDLYFGAGLGVAKTKGEIEGKHADEFVLINHSGSNEMSYQALVGVSYKATEKIDLTLGYRRAWIHDVSFTNGDIKVSTPESLELGIRYKF